MELSKRLRAVADMVSPGNITADIGCDHGYVSIYLVENKIAPKVIAMDINKGPLERAQQHIVRYGCSDYIETRLSDGAAKLEKGEADSLICAGMGGKLILHILSQDYDTIQQMKECIVQPQSEIALFRKTIAEWGYTIQEENIIYEDGKFYPIMRMVYSGELTLEKMELTDEEAKYGPILLKNKNPVLLQFLKQEYKKIEHIAAMLPQEADKTEKTRQRRNELEKEKEIIFNAFRYYSKEEIDEVQ